MKRLFYVLLLVLISVTGLNANEVTKIGIVDLSKIYARYPKASASSRKIDDLKNEYFEVLDNKKVVIEELEKRRIEAVNDDNQELILQLDSEIALEKDNLQQYERYKRKEINNKIATEYEKSGFADIFYEEIIRVAEKNGYSIIMKKSDENIFWYSNSIDITDLVIQGLTE